MTALRVEGESRVEGNGHERSTEPAAAPPSVQSLWRLDGRVAVVNCDSKYALKFDNINQRSCRVPSVDQFEAQFNGEKAKLFWRVGVSGEKEKSETYRLIEILEPLRQN